MTDDELKRLFDALRQDTTEIRQENAAAHEKTRQHFDVSVDETRRHFDVSVEQMEKRFDLLAESVAHLDGELQRTRISLDEKIEGTAAETQAMIKFSHKELDHRMTALEDDQRTLRETVAGLQARVERLEGSTH